MNIKTLVPVLFKTGIVFGNAGASWTAGEKILAFVQDNDRTVGKFKPQLWPFQFLPVKVKALDIIG